MTLPMWNPEKTGLLFDNGAGGLRYVDSGPEFDLHKNTAGPFAQLPDPEPDLEVLAQEVRDKRNALLSASDWTQVADAPVDKTAWAAYRQELRDITEQVGFPTEVIWPTKPV